MTELFLRSLFTGVKGEPGPLGMKGEKGDFGAAGKPGKKVSG